LDKAIVTTFMIVAGVIAAVLVFNAVFPAVVQGNGALVGMGARIDDGLRTQITVIHATQSPEYTDVALVWVKNTGSVTIKPIERCDVFFGPEGNYQLIPYGSGVPHWEYTVENDSAWKPTATLKITVDLSYPLTAGERYYFKLVTPNGTADEYYFSVGG